MQKADHSGHRMRMKKKLAKYGLDAFEPHEVLEIMLYYAIPQRDTNNIAKQLIDHFGSFSSLLDAPPQALRSAGLTEHQILYLKMIPDLTRLYLLDKHQNTHGVFGYSDISSYIIDRFIGFENKEHVLLILMDVKGKAVYSGIVSHGDFSSASISFRDIIMLALNYAATSAFLAHCHPSGQALPSKEDILVTRELKEALRTVGVELVDHYIVADHDCVSLADSGLI